MTEALDIWVKGIVQGVGFRPFVYRMAKKYLITGWVLNGVDGVHIHAEGESKLLDEFVMELSENAPAAAQVTEIEMHEVPLEPYTDFQIRTSDDAQTDRTTLVSPDLATCADCAAELFDPADRRYRYPFINCTNCGPRFTIINELPYDRANTSMAPFTMCNQCQTEYDDPTDRRFHAQPNACFDCGPALTFRMSGSSEIMEAHDREGTDAIFTEAVKMLLEGKILAVKGLGGFHLVCDANNEEAVSTLRQRKMRDGKPFAVMMTNLADVNSVCRVSNDEAAILQGSQRPIVLLRKRKHAQLVEGLADRLPELGVMLPYTPVQHILLHDFAAAVKGAAEDAAKDAGDTQTAQTAPMLVMTSGNLHDEPIVIDDAEAYEKLGNVADAFIGNDRRIVSRFDDTVLRVINVSSTESAVQFIRRARGYAPSPIVLKGVSGALAGALTGARVDDAGSQACVFATGAEQKDTFTFLRPIPSADSEGNGDAGAGATQAKALSNTKSALQLEAFVSQHIGDMENAETFDAWLETKDRYQKLFSLSADQLACDLHPEYLTSKWAEEKAALATPPIPLTKVQHHHAHIVAAMAENGINSAVCGIAFDGTGYGADGNIWGGEILISNLADYERFINFAYVPMPGGQAAIKNPLRMAYGVLWEFDLLEHPGAHAALKELGEEQASMCDQMIEQGLNTPVTSSVGRLFDAASALLGVCEHPAYEGEAAILLEAALWEWLDSNGEGNGDDDPEQTYAIDVIKNTATDASTAHDTSVFLFDAASMFERLLDDKNVEVEVGLISKRFHDAFVQAIVQAAQLCDALYGIRTVVLSGGVFMNRYIIERSLEALSAAGYTVAINRELPPNDGCISLGQSLVGFKY